MTDNFYDTLGIRRSASTLEVRAAYLRLARIHHPDLNLSDSTATEKFRRIQLAYDVLGDAFKRAAYDRDPQSFRASQLTQPAAAREQTNRPIATAKGSFQATTQARANYNDLPISRSSFPWFAFAMVAASFLTVGGYGLQYYRTQPTPGDQPLAWERSHTETQPVKSPAEAIRPSKPVAESNKSIDTPIDVTTKGSFASSFDTAMFAPEGALEREPVEVKHRAPKIDEHRDEPVFGLSTSTSPTEGEIFVVTAATLNYQPEVSLAGIDLSPPGIGGATEQPSKFLAAMIASFSPDDRNDHAPDPVRDSKAPPKEWQSKLQEAWQDADRTVPITTEQVPRIEQAVDFQLGNKYGYTGHAPEIVKLPFSANAPADLEVTMISVLPNEPATQLPSMDTAGRDLCPPYRMVNTPTRPTTFDLRTNFSVPENGQIDVLPWWVPWGPEQPATRHGLDAAQVRAGGNLPAERYPWRQPATRTSQGTVIQAKSTEFQPLADASRFGFPDSTGSRPGVVKRASWHEPVPPRSPLPALGPPLVVPIPGHVEP